MAYIKPPYGVASMLSSNGTSDVAEARLLPGCFILSEDVLKA